MINNDFIKKYQTVLLTVLIIISISLALWVLKPFYGVLLWSASLSVLMYPFYKKLRKRINENISAVITLLLTAAIFVIPMSLIGFVLVLNANNITKEFSANAPTGADVYSVEYLITTADNQIRSQLAHLGIESSFSEILNENKEQIVKSGIGILKQMASSLFNAVITTILGLVAMFFMLRDGHKLKEPALTLMQLPEETALVILNRLADTIRAIFFGVILIAITQGLIAGLIYKLLGVDSPLLLSIATSIFALVPLLGPPVVYVPIAVLLIIQGEWLKGILLIVLGFGVISSVDNILYPLVVGSKVKIHPAGVLFSIIGAVIAFGPVGLIAGPLLLTVILGLYDIMKAHLTNKIQNTDSSAAETV